MDQCLFGSSLATNKSNDLNAETNTINKTSRVTKENSQNTNFRTGGMQAAAINICAALLIVFGIYKTITGLLQLPSEHFPIGIINIVGTLLIWYGVYGLFSRESWSYMFVLCIAVAGAIVLAAELITGWLGFDPHLLLVSILIVLLIVLLILSKKTITESTEV